MGDSRAVLCRRGQAVALSSDHKPDRPDERRRIEELGGRVARSEAEAEGGGKCAACVVCCLQSGPYRVYPGGLAVARTLGDIGLKASVARCGGGGGV